MENADMEDTPSPCIGVCKLDEITGLCNGCRRNLDEIKGWKNYGEEEKRQVLARIDKRG